MEGRREGKTLTIGIHVHGPVVQGWDGEVLGKVDALVAAVGIGTVATGRKPAFIAQTDHVLGVERLDVFAYGGGPVCDN